MTIVPLAHEPADGAGLLQSVVLGLVEGVTEFLPVSSTGHLIVTNALMGRSDPTFEVAIQTGAITAIVVLYRHRLWQALRTVLRPEVGGRTNLLWLIVAAALPAAALGLLAEDPIDRLLFNPTTVALALVAGGILLLALERWLGAREARGEPPRHEIDSMGLRAALVIGAFQCLALIPGTSRSAATIAGALVIGLRRTAAAQFSFLVGVPILYGAALLKVARDPGAVAGERLPALLLASLVAFVTAMVTVVPFVRFLQRHTFRPFAYYRIVAGAALLALVAAGVV